ncbi:MAG: DUF2911 domain-containing protein [Thermoanaerobaculia bacterium]|nr:DUF2911 domain-containing protein [Thermoanaerobaculia bacterium]
MNSSNSSRARHTLRALALASSFGLLITALPASAQDLHPSRRPSPTGIARTTVGDTYLKVVYSRPYERGRDNIFGTEESEALVPFGKVWRTGANEATEITLTGDVEISGKKLPAGTYSIFTVPGPENWTVHFNSALGLSGTGTLVDGKFTPLDLDATDVLVATAPVVTLPEDEKVEQFTIAFEEAEGGTDLVFTWINTQVRVALKVE